MSHVDMTATPRRQGNTVLRGLLTLSAGAGIVYWLFFSFVLATIRCGDSCGGYDAEHWRWEAQLLLAVLGSVLGMIALVLGLRSGGRAYRLLLVTSLGCALTWAAWVVAFGQF